MLADVGVNVEIRVVEWGVWLGEVYRGDRDFDLTVIGHTGKLDPTGRLGGYGDPDVTYVGWDDATSVELLAEAAAEPDQQVRADLYAQVLRHMHDTTPFIYFGASNRSHAHRANVEGFWMTPLLDSYDFRSVSVQ
jgi:ABC-type dipeptide transport system, periplasmic component